jgi:hypothetical protein
MDTNLDMDTNLETVTEPSRLFLGSDENRATSSATSSASSPSNHARSGTERRADPGPARLDATASPTLRSNGQPGSFLAAWIPTLDGLRIPPSPLHDL